MGIHWNITALGFSWGYSWVYIYIHIHDSWNICSYSHSNNHDIYQLSWEKQKKHSLVYR